MPPSLRDLGETLAARDDAEHVARLHQVGHHLRPLSRWSGPDFPASKRPLRRLVLQIAPDEGVSLQFEVKRPGPVVDLAAVKMDFRFHDWFPKEPNVGYETLIYDVMIGDPTLFMRADMVEQTWRIVQPVLDAWAAEKADFPNYDSGSDGPKASDQLLTASGDKAWRPLSASAKPKPHR